MRRVDIEPVPQIKGLSQKESEELLGADPVLYWRVLDKGLTIEHTWILYDLGRARGDGEAYKRRLVEQYAPLVEDVARNVRGNTRKVRLRDLVKAGRTTLANLIDTYPIKDYKIFRAHARDVLLEKFHQFLNSKEEAGPDIDNTWASYHRTNGIKYRNLLIEHYKDLVRYAAERIHARLPGQVELDDLISSGIFGLMDALRDYDPRRGVKFETYCAHRIRGAILDELRKRDWVPRGVRIRSHQLEKATTSLKMQLGRKPDDRELRKELGLNEEKYRRMKEDSYAPPLLSLEFEVNQGSDDDPVYGIDILKDRRIEDPVSEAQRKSLKKLLTGGLAREERLVISLYYYEELTMKEIGAVLGLSQTRVSQIHSSVIARLKAGI